MLRRMVWCLLFTIAIGGMSGIGRSSAAQESGVARLQWIAGCWVSDDGKERTEEFWLKPAGQSMIGLSRTVAGGKTVFIEYAQIAEAKGEIAYTVALGMGARPVSFKLIKSSDSEAVFENPAHDFPQRIIYRRESRDSLFARIEGKEKGVSKGMDFRYKSAKCD
jgi:hypothetical protein